MVLSAKLLLGASDDLNTPIAPETDAPQFLRRPPIDAASIAHGNSAAAEPAPTQLSATQHLPASDHDAEVQDCC